MKLDTAHSIGCPKLRYGHGDCICGAPPMKATMEFNLDLPEDQDDFDLLSKAKDLRSAVLAALQLLRTRIKHSDMHDERRAGMEEARGILLRELDEHGVSQFVL